MNSIVAAVVVVVGFAGFAGPASAQYYREPPPQGYYPRPDFERGPPPGYYPQREVGPYGQRCEAFLRTQAGPRRLVCQIIRAKPLGEPCACPPPPPPPGYAEGPFVGGRTIP